MVFHVARGFLFCAKVIFEFGKQFLVGLVQNIGQHVQATAMSHTDGELIDTKRRTCLDDIGQCWNQDFRTF